MILFCNFAESVARPAVYVACFVKHGRQSGEVRIVGLFGWVQFKWGHVMVLVNNNEFGVLLHYNQAKALLALLFLL